MKKNLLSSVIIITFILYALFKNRSTVDALPAAGNVKNIPSPVSSNQNNLIFKDGEYTGISADAYYGFIQVKAVIKNGKLTDVIFLRYPDSHGRSIAINTIAMPYLKQEAISAQSARVDIISGATDTSKAFVESLSSALTKAQV